MTLTQKIKVLWCPINNFGDQLNVTLLHHYGYEAVSCIPTNADMVLIGSILDFLPPDFMGTILGSGFMWEKNVKRFEQAKIIGVRGKLSARPYIDTVPNLLYGDPGLLAHVILNRPVSKKFLIGVVPHYMDKDDTRIQLLKERFPEAIHIIDVQQDPKQVIETIAGCEYILSSSLHGLVTADALGIPNRWLVQSNKIMGDHFKFYDYYSSLEIEREFVTLSGNESLDHLMIYTEPPPMKTIQVLQAQIHERLQNLGDFVQLS